MGSLIVMSVIIATVAVPTVAARSRAPVRTVKRVLLFLALFYVAYLAALIYVYAPYYPPEWSP